MVKTNIYKMNLKFLIIAIILNCCFITVFSQANHLKLTKDELKLKYKGDLVENGSTLKYENVLFKYVFHLNDENICIKVMYIPATAQNLEIFLDITNDNYDFVKDNNWIGIERDFTISINYIKNAGDLGNYGVLVYKVD